MSCEQLLAADHPIPHQVTRSSERIHLTPVPSAPGEARRFVRATANVFDDDRLHDLLVLTSELVTNAVLHARTPVEVGVTVTEDAVLICVADGAKGTPQDREQSDGHESGRGIMLVKVIADEWGVLPHETREGKAVWFLLRRSGAEGTGPSPKSGDALDHDGRGSLDATGREAAEMPRVGDPLAERRVIPDVT